jgi:competence transcription factor ComK
VNGKAATPSFTPSIEVLMNASKILESNKIEKEVISDLLSTCAPLVDRSCKFYSVKNYLTLIKSIY